VYLSSNNGQYWAAVDSGLTYPNVYALAINGNDIFTGTYLGGMFFSSNNGSTCTAINSGLPANTIVRAIAVNGDTILAGTYGDGVYISSNNGSSWEAADSGLTSVNILSLAISGNYVFAGTDSRGVFMSSNDGLQWASINTGLTDSTGIYALTISGNTLFAGTSAGGVWKRTLSELGIKEINNNGSNIVIYPNPATDKLTIESQHKSAIEILNIQGQIIMQQQLQQGKTDIDISGLTKGVYVLRMFSNDNTGVTRIVKE
jgi:ligand-binding sensor domain-containing protein